MEVSSLTQNTAACADGVQLRPMMSAALIIRGRAELNPMRLEPVLALAPDSSRHHVADFQVTAEFARAPVLRAVHPSTERRLWNRRFEFQREYRGHLPSDGGCKAQRSAG